MEHVKHEDMQKTKRKVRGKEMPEIKDMQMVHGKGRINPSKDVINAVRRKDRSRGDRAEAFEVSSRDNWKRMCRYWDGLTYSILNAIVQEILVNGEVIPFQIKTGSDGSLLSENTWNKIGKPVSENENSYAGMCTVAEVMETTGSGESSRMKEGETACEEQCVKQSRDTSVFPGADHTPVDVGRVTQSSLRTGTDVDSCPLSEDAGQRTDGSLSISKTMQVHEHDMSRMKLQVDPRIHQCSESVWLSTELRSQCVEPLQNIPECLSSGAQCVDPLEKKRNQRIVSIGSLAQCTDDLEKASEIAEGGAPVLDMDRSEMPAIEALRTPMKVKDRFAQSGVTVPAREMNVKSEYFRGRSGSEDDQSPKTPLSSPSTRRKLPSEERRPSSTKKRRSLTPYLCFFS